METIKNYLDNIFQSLPKTEEIIRLKNELLENMDSRYSDLRQHGKSENEAIGATISEFGDIDELLKEMDITIEVEDNSNLLTPDEINSFLNLTKKANTLIALGVFAIIFGAGIFLGLAIFNESLAVLGLVILLAIIACAVGLFIYSDTLTSEFISINKREFSLSNKTRELLEKEKMINNRIANPLIAIGVMLTILSAIPTIFIGAYGVVFTLILVASGVFLFIYSNGYTEGYEKLLKKCKKKNSNGKLNHYIRSSFLSQFINRDNFSEFIYAVATLIYLISGFIFGQWGTMWIVFIIAYALEKGFELIVNN